MDVMQANRDLDSIVVSAEVSDSSFRGIADLLEWLKKLLDQANVCSHKDEIIALADAAIDRLVAIDIPSIPPLLEGILDRILERYLKARVRSMIDQVCP